MRNVRVSLLACHRLGDEEDALNILSKSTKIRIFKSNVRAVLLYGCESWRMTKGDEAKLDTFQHKCLRRLLKIYWPMCMSNEEVRRRANSETISELGRKRRWTWIGHVLCIDNRCLPRVALTWAPEGKRKRGKPKETWRRERIALGFSSWVEAGLAAANRVSWRSMISSPILHTERRNWWWWWYSIITLFLLFFPKLCSRCNSVLTCF